MLTSCKPVSKVETLAKLYLEGKSIQLSDYSQTELGDWLMQQFRQTPVNAEFTDEQQYQNLSEIFADIAQDHLWVSAEESCDASIYANPFYGFAFLVMHDYDL